MGEVRFFMDDTVHAWLKDYAVREGITMKEAVEKIILDWQQEKGMKK